MQVSNRSWSLFGLDLRPWLNLCRAGWRELIQGRASGIRARLEAPVALHDGESAEPDLYVAETPIPRSAQEPTEAFPACRLPDDHVLARTLTLPETLEAQLQETLALEVQANSPFGMDDTSWGWTIQDRAHGKLQVSLAMAATSSIMEFLRQSGYNPDAHDDLPEVWCFTGEGQHPVILQGFGEDRRRQAYRKRLHRLGGVSVWLLAAVLGLLAVPGLVRDMQADNLEQHYQTARQEADRAMQLREELAAHNERLEYLQERLENRADYHRLLAHLSEQTADDTYLQQLEAQGNRINLQGHSADAAGFMQMLTEDDRYREVRAPAAIRHDPRTGLERFSLEFRLNGGQQGS